MLYEKVRSLIKLELGNNPPFCINLLPSLVVILYEESLLSTVSVLASVHVISGELER